jgi:transposase
VCSAYHLREDLTDLFARDDAKAGATGAIRAWCQRMRQRGLVEFERALGTLDRRLEEITHAFRGRQTSGVVAGFHNRVKVLTRRGYGRFNVGRRFQRLTLDWHGYHLFGHP